MLIDSSSSTILRDIEVSDDEGQTMAEYGIVLTVICVATVAIFAAFADRVAAAVDRAVDLLPG